MTDAADENLVDEIVRRVVDVLGVGAAAPPAPAPAGGSRVWLTTEMLVARAGGADSVSLGANELLTPAARDHAAARGIEVVLEEPLSRAAPATATTGGQVRPAVLMRTLGLVVHRPDAKAAAALAALGRSGLVAEGFDESDCWMANTRALCEAVAAGRLAGGVVLDRYAAAPMALAGKARGVRAVQGVSVAAVTAALRQFDANVLVVGHVPVSLFEIRSMIDRFAAGRRMGRDRTALLDAVDEMEARR